MKLENKTITETDSYYACERCVRDSLNSDMFPCPINSCEAIQRGVIIKTTEIKIHTNPDQEHLKFIYNRMMDMHKENPDVDYMLRFKQIIDNFPINTSNSNK